MQTQKNEHLCFIDYTKVFDKVRKTYPFINFLGGTHCFISKLDFIVEDVTMEMN